jgi:hypothetical protein
MVVGEKAKNWLWASAALCSECLEFLHAEKNPSFDFFLWERFFPQKRKVCANLKLDSTAAIPQNNDMLPRPFIFILAVMGWMLLTGNSMASPQVTLVPAKAEVQVHDFLELTLQVKASAAANPFTDVEIKASFRLDDQPPIAVTGFCDALDGSQYKLRFLPRATGTYAYDLTYQEGSFAERFSGKFLVIPSPRKGLLQIHPDAPYHFRWEGSQEPVFLNGTTAYWLLGWEDENTIQQILNRFAANKVNRVRMALCGRTHSGNRWHEPNVVSNDQFKLRLSPWALERPDDVENPGIDVTRFNPAYWQKLERVIRMARRLNIILSMVFYVDGQDPGVDPFGKALAGSDDEKRYYAYAANRLSAYSNIVWDLTNEYRLFRDDAWAQTMGDYLSGCDPYGHLMSVHGHGDFKFRTSGWADYAVYQSWDQGGGYAFMLKNRTEQEQSGHAKPQINEEYGYEDHYPVGWGGDLKSPARNADSRRRLAWEMTMAGGYQTTGERADLGTGKGADQGGGWLNGRGNDQMTLLTQQARMVDFFTSFEWWKCRPVADVIKEGRGYCLAEIGRVYALYLPEGGTVKIALPDGKFSAELFNCLSGERKSLGELPSGEWTSPAQPKEQDWAILIRG